MKLIYGIFEIEIKAKVKGAKRYSEEVAQDVVRDLITNLVDATEYARMIGCPSVAKRKEEIWTELFDQLEATGYFKR